MVSKLCAFLTPAALAVSTFEYLAFVPNAGRQSGTNPAINWVKLEYPQSGPDSASDVSVTPVTKATTDLGSWYNMGMGSDVKGASLTAKILGSNMYAYVNTGVAPNAAGCCADTLRVYPKSGSVRDIDLESVMQEAFPGSSFAHATHTFDVGMLGGELHAFTMVQYEEPTFNNVKVDSIVAVKLSDGSIRQTASGDNHFSIYSHLGTTSSSADDTRFRMQYHASGVDDAANGGDEQWHGNGVKRFQAIDGTWILALTQRFANGAVLLKDPFTYSASQGGGQIVQRFGTPAIYAGSSISAYHYFGMGQDAGHISTGVHNLWHNVYGERETLTMFVNGMTSDSFSHVYEFDINLTNEDEAVASDEAFATNFSTATFSYQANAQGGARSMGNDVFIGASGIGSFGGYEIVDVHGGSQKISHTANLYDPFVRVTADDLIMV